MKTGAQQTTIIASCGFSTKGSPKEARGKLKIHLRHCVKCKDSLHTIPQFNNSKKSAHNSIAVSKRGNPIIRQPIIQKISDNEMTYMTKKEFDDCNT